MDSNSLILISGSPGTGKTTVAKYLKEKYGHTVISLTEVVKQHKLYSEYDEPRDTYVIDPDKLDAFLREKIANFYNTPGHDGYLIIEGHYADLVESEKLAAAFVLRCHPLEVEGRLQARNYSEAKIRENIQAELLGNCTSYMLEHPALGKTGCIYELRSDQTDIPQLAETIQKIMSGEVDARPFKAGKLSWLSDPSVPLAKYLD